MKAIVLIHIIVIGVMSGCGEAPPQKTQSIPNSSPIDRVPEKGDADPDVGTARPEKGEFESDSIDPDEKGGAKNDGKG